MRLKLIACKIIERELASLSYRCPNTVDATLIRQDLHQSPGQLRRELQLELDKIDSNSDTHTNDASGRGFDAVLLGYGLCSNAALTLGSKKYPLVVPRAHDCITLCLGSKESYTEYFNAHPGTYYYTRGWHELGLNPGAEQLEQKRREYTEKYSDDDIVDYLMEVEGDMLRHYSNMAYISWECIPGGSAPAELKSAAAEKGWRFELLEGSDSLLRRLLWGEWDVRDFLVVPPGGRVAPSYDGGIIKVE